MSKNKFIKFQIHQVWELINKPHRFFIDLYKEVEKLPLGEYEVLDFDKKTKKEILIRIKEYLKSKNNDHFCTDCPHPTKEEIRKHHPITFQPKE